MEIYLTRRVLLVALMIIFCTAIAYSQGADTPVEKMPPVPLPESAKTENLYGTILAKVKVDKEGKVKDIVGILGPDWTCPNYKSDGLKALRELIRAKALAASFPPLIEKKKRSSLRWLEFTLVDGTPKGSSVGNKEVEGNGKTASTGVLSGRMVSLVQPRLPDEARIMHLSGMVEVRVLISEKGRVISAVLFSGDQVFSDVSRAAACESRFAPTLLEGKPVKVSGVIRYTFNQ